MTPQGHSNWSLAAVLIVLILSIAGCQVAKDWRDNDCPAAGKAK